METNSTPEPERIAERLSALAAILQTQGANGLPCATCRRTAVFGTNDIWHLLHEAIAALTGDDASREAAKRMSVRGPSPTTKRGTR